VTNRLAHETSPYLRQHAHNPVDWYPWGDEALSRARAEDRPILLSIGYSACHWCHVMERESFDDPSIAALMNRDFVNVKVDREERPDIDSIYMRAVQAMTGHGGWPLTAFLTPEGVPFYGGTYFPPEPRQGMPSFRQILQGVAEAWTERRDRVLDGSRELRAMLERSVTRVAGDGPGEGPPEGVETEGDGSPSGIELLDVSLLEHAVRFLSGQFDPKHGGLGRAPKFPQPVTLEFLLREHARTGDPQPLTMVTHTLHRMLAGGIHDQLGGGFHRYSVDARWLVPHFEKMLYDQALLARILSDAYLLTGDPALGRGAQRTLEYVLADLRSPEGAFHSARDADSEGEEGVFYLWTPEQVRSVLPEGDADLFMRFFDVTPVGNFEGSNILHRPHDLEVVARSEGVTPEELEDRLERCRLALLEARAHREPPFRDEKAIASWNGFAIRALAEVGAALGREDFVTAAREAATFLLGALRREDRLHRIWMEGEARIPAFLEDHAALGNALLSLHEATLEPRWLAEAIWMADRIASEFLDPESGILFDSPRDGEPLVVRPRDIMDTATPSGNSMAVELWLRLAPFTGDPGHRTEIARRLLAREAHGMARFPSAFGRLLSGVGRLLAVPVEVAIIGPGEDPRTRALLSAAHRRFLPNRAVTGAAPSAPPLPFPAPLLESRGMRGGKPAAYICRDHVCGPPVTEAEGVEAALG